MQQWKDLVGWLLLLGPAEWCGGGGRGHLVTLSLQAATDNLCKRLDQGHDGQNVGPDQDPNGLTLW